MFSPSSSISIDERRFPLMLVAIRDGHQEQDFAWLLAEFEQRLLRGKRYALIMDARELCSVPSPGTRQLIATWQKEHLESSKRWNVCTALLVSSSLVRGALTAMSWVVEYPSPTYYPASLDEALSWCVNCLVESGIEVDALTRLRASLPPPLKGP